MSGSLSSVVSDLVRASMGSSVPKTVQEDDVDRYVAELILKEAKQKAAKYGTEGIRAYLPAAESNAPRTNKRFLSSIIKSTDDHNKTILRAQALAAQEVRMEREEEERRERKARAEEAVAAERLRRMMGRASSGWDVNWDHGRQRERDRSRRKRERSVDDEYEEERLRHDNRKRRRHHSHHHHRHRSRSVDRGSRLRDEQRKSRSPEWRSRHDSEYEKSRRHTRHRSRSPTRASNEERKRSDRDGDEHRTSSLPRSSRSIERSRSPSPSSGKRRKRSPSSHSDGDREDSSPAKRSKHRQTDDYEAELYSKLKARSPPSSLQPPRVRSPTPDLEIKRSQSSPKDSASSSQTTIGPATPSPPPNLPSKMDKYFAETYDPRLDVAPLIVPTIPATGLISDAEFEGWDAMLELIRLRREDKEEKKRLERMGISTKDVKGKKLPSVVGEKWDSSGGTGSIMDIEYKKRGSVREWDMGKEGF